MKKALIIANGKFPQKKTILNLIKNAEFIICCDGAINNLTKKKISPNLIIGDLDSISNELKQKYNNILVQIDDQNTNDLTKAINWCVKNNFLEVEIIAATGKRDDHAIGNIALLSKYAKALNVRMITDYGIFTPILETTTFKSFIGQQISIFSLNPNLELTSENLKYPLNKLQLHSWWMGTLNEATANNFTISFENKGEIIIYQNN
jgi:thiamine pyrophosphokinase